jgi:hypothetical protein
VPPYVFELITDTDYTALASRSIEPCFIKPSSYAPDVVITVCIKFETENVETVFLPSIE